MTPTEALLELRATFRIVHRVATHQSNEAYMSIPADPKRDADLRHDADPLLGVEAFVCFGPKCSARVFRVVKGRCERNPSLEAEYSRRLKRERQIEDE